MMTKVECEDAVGRLSMEMRKRRCQMLGKARSNTPALDGEVVALRIL